MKRREFVLAASAAVAPALWSLPAWAQDAGSYIELGQPVAMNAADGKIEVIEFFSYGCSHCMNFEPIFERWVEAAPEDVVVHRVHVGFNKGYEPLQKIYFSLQAAGLVDELQMKVFEAFQKERIRLDKPEVFFDWVEKQGHDRKKVEAAYNSFGVASQIKQANKLQDAYQVEATPALGIAGRYYSDPGKTRGFEGLIQTTNALLERERKRDAG